MRAPLVVVAFLLASLLAAPAQAAVTVLGSAAAEDCYKAALLPNRGRGVDACDKAIEIGGLSQRDLAGTYVNRGILYVEQRLLQRANADFDRALSLKPGLAEAYVNRGNVRVYERRFESAVEDYDRAIAAGLEKLHVAHYNRGLAYEGLRRFDDAEKDFRTAVTLMPNFTDAQEKVALYDRRAARLRANP